MKEVIFIIDGQENSSLENFFLLLKSPPKISAPEAKTYYVDIPGSHGQLDLSTALTGGVKYKNRKIELEFVCAFMNRVYNNYIYRILLNALHEKTVTVKLPDDDILETVWTGKILIGEPEIEKDFIMSIKMTIDAYPYSMNSSGNEVL